MSAVFITFAGYKTLKNSNDREELSFIGKANTSKEAHDRAVAQAKEQQPNSILKEAYTASFHLDHSIDRFAEELKLTFKVANDVIHNNIEPNATKVFDPDQWAMKPLKSPTVKRLSLTNLTAFANGPEALRRRSTL